jgi:hypothetical protein
VREPEAGGWGDVRVRLRVLRALVCALVGRLFIIRP